MNDNTKSLICLILSPKRWKIQYFGGTSQSSLTTEELLHEKLGLFQAQNYDHLSKRPFCMCVSTEKSSQRLDVRGPEDGWLLEFRVWESSLTDTITSQQAHRFSLITSWGKSSAIYLTMVAGIALPKFHPRPVSVSSCVCGLLMRYLYWLCKTSRTDCQHSSNHFDFSIEGWITLEWTLSDPWLSGQD